MTLGQLNLTVFSAALFCFGSVGATPSNAMPQRPWYETAFARVLHLVSNDGDAAKVPQKVAEVANQTYVSRITKDSSSITLRGDVPSESDLKILQGVAAATSPGATVNDKSRVNGNVPDHDGWLAAMTFALRQLSKLDNGSAVLRNTVIAIDGVTKAGDDFATVYKKLNEEKPKGLSVQVALKPHDVHPFVWLAQLQQGTVNLTGHVPDHEDQVLCSYAQSLFRNLKVNNRMEFANGEPRDWLAASKVALDMLSLLYAGNVAISDNVIKVDGIYMSPAMAGLFDLYSHRLPKGFVVEKNILEPVARAPAARAEDVSLAAAHNAAASLNP